MSIENDATIFTSLFADVYLHFYRRLSPGEYQISPESLAIILHLNQSGPLTVQEAAVHFSRSQSAMSEILERLEKRNLLQRIPDERDKRRHLVWLTEKGRDVIHTEQQVLSKPLLMAAMERLDDTQKSELFNGLNALLDAAKTVKP
ncbi:MAG: MarR family transcriptional regulator [Deltaproteobacteria bacterium]|nr:MarR family transcriptional regulator [Deltaproteobacteria bacterium]